MDDDLKVDVIFNHLLETGALVLKGMSPSGEPVYSVTEKCKEIFPEFYAVHRQELNSMAYDLWAKGLIDIVFGDIEERAVFNKTHIAKLKELYDELSQAEAQFLISLGAPIEIKQIP
jgi:hypothetical protein